MVVKTFRQPARVNTATTTTGTRVLCAVSSAVDGRCGAAEKFPFISDILWPKHRNDATNSFCAGKKKDIVATCWISPIAPSAVM